MTSPTTTPQPRRSHKVRRAVTIAVVVAGVTVGVGGAFAVATAQDDPAPVACSPTSADLTQAAYAARMLEAQRPDLFEQSPRPADQEDLRLAAEWSSRMSVLQPDGQPTECRR